MGNNNQARSMENLFGKDGPRGCAPAAESKGKPGNPPSIKNSTPLTRLLTVQLDIGVCYAS